MSKTNERKRVRGSTTPRVYTAPLRELTPETSRGFEAITFGEDVLGFRLLPWQKWLLVHLLEMREDGRLRFHTAIVEVARQNGKTTLAVVFCLWRMFMDGSRLVLGTAQSLETSETTWEEAVDLVRNTPDLAAELVREQRGAGQKMMKLANGAQWRVAPTNRRGGRSKSADTVIFDELREHQTWDAWAAIRNTTMARPNAMILAISNAGDAKSVVLQAQRERAIKDLDAGSSLAYFGWTAPDDARVDDETAWAQANPGLGYTITLDAMRDALRDQPERDFRTENLCQWVTAAKDTFLDPAAWDTCADPASMIADDSPIYGGIDVSADRSYTSIAVAGWRPDGLPHVEVIAVRAGMLWVPDFLRQVQEAQPMLRGWAIQARGCAAAEFIPRLQAERAPVTPVEGAALGAACGQLADRVRDRTLRHLDQPALNVSAYEGVARRLGGDQMVWDRRGSEGVDLAPIVAATWALHALAGRPEAPAPVSAYDGMSEWWRDLTGETGQRQFLEELEPREIDSDETDWWTLI